MDTNDLLIWFSGLGAVANALALLVGGRARARTWLVVYAANLLGLSVAVALVPEVAGYVGLLLFLGTILLPEVLSRALTATILGGRYARAVTLARVLAVLHPFRRVRAYPKIVAAMARPELRTALSPEEHALFLSIDEQLVLARHAMASSEPMVRRANLATLTMVLANVVAFALELQGGLSEENLYALGALDVPIQSLAHDAWRMLAACFLHGGILHLTMNLLGLLVFGGRVEQRLGRWRFLFVYLLSGVLGMAGYAALALVLDTKGLVVGASGCVMGMIGAMAAIAYVDWRRQRSPLLRRQLGILVIVVGTQVVFDASHPEVAMSVHLAGLVIGALATALVLPRLSAPAASASGG